MRTNSKRATVIGGTVLALTAGGVAYAYWTTSGTGSGSGTTTAGTVNMLTFDQNTLTAMYPGDSVQNLTVKVTNTAGENAYVTGVKAYITTTSEGCTGADYLLGGTAAPSTSETARALTWTAQDLAKSSGNANATSTIQFNNTGAAQNACKGAAVTIHYIAS